MRKFRNLGVSSRRNERRDKNYYYSLFQLKLNIRDYTRVRLIASLSYRFNKSRIIGRLVRPTIQHNVIKRQLMWHYNGTGLRAACERLAVTRPVTMEGPAIFRWRSPRIGNSCIAGCSVVCNRRCTRVRASPDFNDHASDISGDDNVRTLFITDRFCAPRATISADIAITSRPRFITPSIARRTRRTCNSEIKKTGDIYDCEIPACTFRIKRGGKGSGGIIGDV